MFILFEVGRSAAEAFFVRFEGANSSIENRKFFEKRFCFLGECFPGGEPDKKNGDVQCSAGQFLCVSEELECSSEAIEIDSSWGNWDQDMVGNSGSFQEQCPVVGWCVEDDDVSGLAECFGLGDDGSFITGSDGIGQRAEG